MSVQLDMDTSRLLRVLGNAAVRLSEGQTIDEDWLQQQFSASTDSYDRPEDQHPSDLLTIPEVCGRLRISRWSLYQLIHQQRLDTLTIGRRRFVAQGELNRFVNSLSVAGGAT